MKFQELIPVVVDKGKKINDGSFMEESVLPVVYNSIKYFKIFELMVKFTMLLIARTSYIALFSSSYLGKYFCHIKFDYCNSNG